MESNIIKAVRELSLRTDTNIANTRRELISQMAKSQRELDSGIAQHHREIDSKVAETQQELDSEMASNHRELKYEVDKLDTMNWMVYITFLLSLVCIKYLQAAFNLMLISTSTHFLECVPWRASTELTLLCLELPLGSCSRQSTGPRLKRQKLFLGLIKLEKRLSLYLLVILVPRTGWCYYCLISTSRLLPLPLLYYTLDRCAKQTLWLIIVRELFFPLLEL